MKNVNKNHNYKIKLILFPNGERFPLLINSNTSMPDYWCTLYCITQMRAKGRAVETIKQTIHNIMFFKIVLIKLNINEQTLNQRLKEGYILYLHEIEGLTEQCKLFLEDILANITTSASSPFATTSLEKYRAKNSNKVLRTVDPSTSGNRIRDIRDFLDWRINVRLSKLKLNNPIYKKLIESKKFVKNNLSSRIPKSSNNISLEGIEGLSKKNLQILYEMTKFDSPINPWKSEFTKKRNELIFIWLLQFGLRRSELLNIKISDINFQKETFLVLRRSDDPEDPRKDQPNVKTRGRKLAIPKKVIDLTYNFITNYRSKLPEAKKHDFLIVADKTGKPLSKIAVNKVFEKVKETNKSLPKYFSPHILRHTWNDKFSELMDENNIPEESEKSMRNNLMGWNPTSNTAETYTKRHIRKKADDIILKMSDKLFNNSKNDKE